MDIQAYLRTKRDDEVARAVGVSVRTVGSWRRGERKPKFAHLLKLIDYSNRRVLRQVKA